MGEDIDGFGGMVNGKLEGKREVEGPELEPEPELELRILASALAPEKFCN